MPVEAFLPIEEFLYNALLGLVNSLFPGVSDESAANFSTPTSALGKVAVKNAGQNYTHAPTVYLIGGGGKGGKLLAVVAGGKVAEIVVLDAGQGYTSAPTLFLAGGGGSGAQATITLANPAAGKTTFTPSASYPVGIYPCLPDPNASPPFIVYSRVRTNITDRPLDPADSNSETATMLVEVYATEMFGQFDVLAAGIKAGVADGGLNGASTSIIDGVFLQDFRFGTYALKQVGGSINVIHGQIYFGIQLAESL